MEWVSIIIVSGREDNFDSLVSREDEGVLSNIEVVLLSSAFENLLKGRSLGREVGNAVDVPLSLSGSLACTDQFS